MVPCDPQELVVPNEDAERRRRMAAESRARAEELKEKGKLLLDKGMDALENLEKDGK